MADRTLRLLGWNVGHGDHVVDIGWAELLFLCPSVRNPNHVEYQVCRRVRLSIWNWPTRSIHCSGVLYVGARNRSRVGFLGRGVRGGGEILLLNEELRRKYMGLA